MEQNHEGEEGRKGRDDWFEGKDCVEVGNSWDWRVEHENGTGSAKSEINLVADRYHQDNILSCHVNTRALKVRL